MKRSDSKHLRRLLASRANARKSTGPKTAAGKRISSQNALDHGLTAQTLLLPGESDARFRSLLAGFEADLQPQNTLDQFHVEQLAAAAWRIRRAQVYENNLVREALEQSTPDEALRQNPARAITLAWAGSGTDRATRYEATHHRHFRHHLAELRHTELTRLCGEPASDPAAQSNQEFNQKIEKIRNEASLEKATPESEDRAA